MDDDKLQKTIERGRHAEALVKDDLLQDTFKAIEAAYVEAWRQPDPEGKNRDARERLWMAIQIVGSVRDHLNATLGNGKMAKRKLDEIMGLKAA